MFEVAQNDTQAYRQHKLARQTSAAAANAVFSVARATGDYRLNTAVFSLHPDDPQFHSWGRTFYEETSSAGRFARKIFLPRGAANIHDLHTSGLQWRRTAAWGAALVPPAARLWANLYYGFDGHSNNGFAEMEETTFLQQTAIGLDTVAVSTQTAGMLASCTGQQMALHPRWRPWLSPILRRSWQAGIVGNGFQMGAGMLRVGLETHHYLESGQLNNSTIYYGVADAFGGAAGIGWSHAVLKEARAARTAAQAAATGATPGTAASSINGITREQHALLSVVEPASRVRIGLRVAGSVGAAVGLGFNIYSLTEVLRNPSLDQTTRRKKIFSNSIGIAGSVLMIGAALMVGTVAAPLAGVALAAGTVALIGQTVAEYYG